MAPILGHVLCLGALLLGAGVDAWISPPGWPRAFKNKGQYTQKGNDLVNEARSLATSSGKPQNEEFGARVSGAYLSAVLEDPNSQTWSDFAMGLRNEKKEKWAAAAYLNALMFDPFNLVARKSIQDLLGRYMKGGDGKTSTLFRPWGGNIFIATSTGLREAGTRIGSSSSKAQDLSAILCWAAVKLSSNTTGTVWQDFIASIYQPASLVAQQGQMDGYGKIAETMNKRVLYLMKRGYEITQERYHNALDAETQSRYMRIKNEVKTKKKTRKVVDKWIEELNIPFLNPLFEEEWMSPSYDYFFNGYVLNALGLYNEAVVYLYYAKKIDQRQFAPWIGMEYAFALGNSGRRKEAKKEIKAIRKEWPDIFEHVDVVDHILKTAPKTGAFGPLAHRGLKEGRPKPEEEEALTPFMDEFGEAGRKQAVEDVGPNWARRLEEYTEQHSTVMGQIRQGFWNGLAPGSREAGFIVASVNGMIGVGNRALSLSCAFLMALLTNRVLLIHWPNQGTTPLDQLFQLPDVGGTWDWVEAMQGNGDKIINPNAVWETTESFEFFQDSERQHELDTLLCGDLSKRFTKKFVHLHTNQNMIAMLQENENYKQVLELWFGARDPVSAISRYLLRPAPPVALEAARLMRKIQEAGKAGGVKKKQVGHYSIHLRTGMKDSKGNQQHFDATRLDLYFHNDEKSGFKPADHALQCVTEFAVNKRKTKKGPKVVFITGDNAAGRDSIAEEIKAKYKSSVIVVTPDGSPDRLTLKGIQKSQAELWVLSMSTGMLRVGKGGTSTFAYLAHALAPTGMQAHLLLSCKQQTGNEADCFTDSGPLNRLGTTREIFARGKITCKGGIQNLLAQWQGLPRLLPECREFQ